MLCLGEIELSSAKDEQLVVDCGVAVSKCFERLNGCETRAVSPAQCARSLDFYQVVKDPGTSVALHGRSRWCARLMRASVWVALDPLVNPVADRLALSQGGAAIVRIAEIDITGILPVGASVLS